MRDELQEHLQAASAVPQYSGGQKGLPRWRQRKYAVRAHAVLLCRLTGLRKVVMEAPAELGGDAFTARAAEELERTVFLKDNEIQTECAHVHSRLMNKQGFNLQEGSYTSGAWVPGLFRIWLYMEGARLIEMEESWRELMRAAPSGELDAPSVFTLDGASVDLGIPSGWDSSQLRRGKAPLRAAWWRVVWAAARQEVRRRYGEGLRIKCTGQAMLGAGTGEVEVDDTTEGRYTTLVPYGSVCVQTTSIFANT